MTVKSTKLPTIINHHLFTSSCFPLATLSSFLSDSQVCLWSVLDFWSLLFWISFLLCCWYVWIAVLFVWRLKFVLWEFYHVFELSFFFPKKKKGLSFLLWTCSGVFCWIWLLLLGWGYIYVKSIWIRWIIIRCDHG